jgi:hypothetical protein
MIFTSNLILQTSHLKLAFPSTISHQTSTINQPSSMREALIHHPSKCLIFAAAQ